MTISFPRLQAVLEAYPKLTVGLIGDLFLDRYLELAPGVHERSLETGLEAYQVVRVRNSPGALGTVMNNLSALGVGRLLPVTVIGDDGHGFDLRRALEPLPVDPSHIISDSERLTPTYTKPLRPTEAGQWEELNRLDVKTPAPLSAGSVRRVCDALRNVFHETDGLIVLDQVNEENWGVVNHAVRSLLADLVQADSKKLVLIDSRMQLGCFSFGVLKGNRSELLAAADTDGQDEVAVREAAQTLSRRTGRPVFCTVGEAGILVAKPDSVPQLVPGCPSAGPADIVGAGDSATSGIVTSLLSGADETEAATVGNLVASITVQQIGTTGTASPPQILARWREVFEP